MGRLCYFVNEAITAEDGQLIVCIAEEGMKGYRKTDWFWGKDYERASMLADKQNEKMGISQNEAWKIIASTMNW